MASLSDIIDDLRRRVGELERRQRAQLRTGVVTQVDAGKWRGPGAAARGRCADDHRLDSVGRARGWGQQDA